LLQIEEKTAFSLTTNESKASETSPVFASDKKCDPESLSPRVAPAKGQVSPTVRQEKGRTICKKPISFPVSYSLRSVTMERWKSEKQNTIIVVLTRRKFIAMAVSLGASLAVALGTLLAQVSTRARPFTILDFSLGKGRYAFIMPSKLFASRGKITA
jgi:hypothetical protein